MGVLVHGVISADAVIADRDLSDAAQRPIRCVTAGALGAVVSDVPGDHVPPARANLLAHLRVLEAAAERTTVLPMRFGVVVPDDATLTTTYLLDREEDLLRALDRLRDRVEMRVSDRYVEDQVIGLVLSDDRIAAGLRGRSDMESKIQLGERITEGIDHRRILDAEPLVEELRPLAGDISRGEPKDAMDVLVASFLVSNDAVGSFEQAVERLRVRIAPVMTIELSGPLPPFSFTED